MKHPLYITKTGFGHWRIETLHYGKSISTTTTDSMSIDEYRSDNTRKSNSAYRNLRRQIIWSIK